MRACILSGPSAVGKTSFVARLVAEHGYIRPQPFTTRAPRAHRVDRGEYDHISQAQANALLRSGLVIAASVLDHTYGISAAVPFLFTPGARVGLHAASSIALEVRKRAVSRPLLVFLMHPDEDIMTRRIRERARAASGEFERRLAHAEIEMRHSHEFDHIIRVDSYEDSYQSLVELLRSAGAEGATC
jgi:guanylate kinase